MRRALARSSMLAAYSGPFSFAHPVAVAQHGGHAIREIQLLLHPVQNQTATAFDRDVVQSMKTLMLVDERHRVATTTPSISLVTCIL
jgi:hypothetical protein